MIDPTDVQAIAKEWDGFKRDQAGKKKLTIDAAGNLVTLPGLSVKEFTTTVDRLSGQLISMFGITDPEMWESLCELMNNGQSVIRR